MSTARTSTDREFFHGLMPASAADDALTRPRARLVEQATADGLVDVAYRTMDSPVGPLLLAATPAGLVRVAFEREDHDAVLVELSTAISPRILRTSRQVDDVARQLDEYFTGRRRRFEAPVDLQLSKGFRRTVLAHLLEIPYGMTESYTTVARAAGNARAVRAAVENTLSRAGALTQGSDSFAADPAVVAGLRDAGFDVLGLANNHLGDFGPRALVQTVRRLRAGGLGTFGAGATPAQAWRPAVVERRGVRLGFLGFNAIGETPSVGPGRPGAVSVGMPPRTGPLDTAALARFTTAVRRLDRRVDAVVVMPHWGTQYTNRPEPIQRRVARRLVAAGADVVVGGHPHWLQAAEMVDGRLVVHSLGNFVFDMDFMPETQEGAILELTFWGGAPRAARFVPYVMDSRYAPRVVTGARGERVLSVMRETSGPAFRRP